MKIMSKDAHLAAANEALVREAKGFIPEVKRKLKEPVKGSTSFELLITVPQLSSAQDIREAIGLCKKDGWNVEYEEIGDSRYITCKP